jgi:hypothetical protein
MRGRQDSARQRSGRNPVLLLWVLVAAAAMVVAGCGNLSLNGVLANESPGEFRLSPETVNVQVGSKFTFSATGGFTPYNYQVVSGLGTVAKDQTWVYQAPDKITGDYIEVLIQATDQLGDSDTATVRVFNPFNIVGATARIMQLPGSVTVEATGGVPEYSWSVDGSVASTGGTSYVYNPATAGIHRVGVTDFLGNYIEVLIIVLPELDAPLTIFPDSAGVKVGETVSFEAYGGTPTYSWTPVTNVNPTTGTPVTYTATTEGTDTVTLTDSTGSSVSATVTVTADTIPPLVLSPEGPTVTAVGDQVQFSAAGGVRPYTFSSSPPGYIDGNGLYTQIGSHKKVNVMVKDSAGAKEITAVYYGP